MRRRTIVFLNNRGAGLQAAWVRAGMPSEAHAPGAGGPGNARLLARRAFVLKPPRASRADGRRYLEHPLSRPARPASVLPLQSADRPSRRIPPPLTRGQVFLKQLGIYLAGGAVLTLAYALFMLGLRWFPFLPGMANLEAALTRGVTVGTLLPLVWLALYPMTFLLGQYFYAPRGWRGPLFVTMGGVIGFLLLLTLGPVGWLKESGAVLPPGAALIGQLWAIALDYRHAHPHGRQLPRPAGAPSSQASSSAPTGR
ncbi:hypothetical protein [Schaalia sp. Marseille-Q2122]|uniref:hypothetical protein n=1 Tax=Schaalia sp. Marseille-Q2122 TaxID=2736604 RepID=UPI00158D15EC|nr:hypothetical protein [Schaalia sp. Marseille-Q2122]